MGVRAHGCSAIAGRKKRGIVRVRGCGVYRTLAAPGARILFLILLPGFRRPRRPPASPPPEHTEQRDDRDSGDASGDWSDAAAAQMAGCTSVLLKSPLSDTGHHDFVVKDLDAAVTKVLDLFVPCKSKLLEAV